MQVFFILFSVHFAVYQYINSKCLYRTHVNYLLDIVWTFDHQQAGMPAHPDMLGTPKAGVERTTQQGKKQEINRKSGGDLHISFFLCNFAG